MKTERMHIEALRPEHAAALFGELSDERIYQHILERPPASVDALEARYTRLAAGSPRSSERWLNWVVFSKASALPLGLLQATVFPEEHRSYIAYILFPSYWKHGFASEGVAWLLQHLSRDHGVRLAEAYIDSRNEASLSVVRRLGFEHRTTVDTDEGKDLVFAKQLGEAS
ncbi:MAG TPA: GNAT family N-acetyltransferase [Polyangiaceae bacterium]|nr:GNAT family N-acetyltransferase [Polyangiaceae bacterium]